MNLRKSKKQKKTIELLVEKNVDNRLQFLFPSLPAELNFYILSLLAPRDLLTLLLVSKAAKKCSEDNYLWFKLFERDKQKFSMPDNFGGYTKHRNYKNMYFETFSEIPVMQINEDTNCGSIKSFFHSHLIIAQKNAITVLNNKGNLSLVVEFQMKKSIYALHIFFGNVRNQIYLKAKYLEFSEISILKERSKFISFDWKVSATLLLARLHETDLKIPIRDTPEHWMKSFLMCDINQYYQQKDLEEFLNSIFNQIQCLKKEPEESDQLELKLNIGRCAIC